MIRTDTPAVPPCFMTVSCSYRIRSQICAFVIYIPDPLRRSYVAEYWKTTEPVIFVPCALRGPFNSLHLQPFPAPGLSVRASAVFISTSLVCGLFFTMLLRIRQNVKLFFSVYTLIYSFSTLYQWHFDIRRRYDITQAINPINNQFMFCPSSPVFGDFGTSAAAVGCGRSSSSSSSESSSASTNFAYSVRFPVAVLEIL